MTKRKHRFFTTYLTATISVALVLLLVGLECVIVLSASELFRHVKETTTLTMVVSDDITSADSLRVTRLLDAAPFCHSYTYISKDQALQDHIATLGEDPTLFLNYNPIHAAFEMQVAADYVQQDSLRMIDSLLSEYEFVVEVDYSQEIVDVFNSSNLSRIILTLLGVALILLFISVALIVNTIRLTVYSRRFIIHTMKLVGATPWMIKGPIVRKSMLMGLIAGVLALIMVCGVVYYVFNQFGILLFAMTWQNIGFVVVTTITVGLLITFFAAVFAVNRYVRMKADDLYFV